MALYSIQDETLNDIAEAIREQTGTKDLIQTSNMSTMIREIEGGGTTKNAVLYIEQDLEAEQKQQARINIDIHVGEEPLDADEGALWINPEGYNIKLNNSIIAKENNDGEVEMFGTTLSEDSFIVEDKNFDGNIKLQMYSFLENEEADNEGVEKPLQSIKFSGLPDTYVIPKQPTTMNIGLLIYQIGSVYLSFSGVNPSTIFGGTWEQIEDNLLLGNNEVYMWKRIA